MARRTSDDLGTTIRYAAKRTVGPCDRALAWQHAQQGQRAAARLETLSGALLCWTRLPRASAPCLLCRHGLNWWRPSTALLSLLLGVRAPYSSRAAGSGTLARQNIVLWQLAPCLPANTRAATCCAAPPLLRCISCQKCSGDCCCAVLQGTCRTTFCGGCGMGQVPAAWQCAQWRCCAAPTTLLSSAAYTG